MDLGTDSVYGNWSCKEMKIYGLLFGQADHYPGNHYLIDLVIVFEIGHP